MSDELEIALGMMSHAANKCDEAAEYLKSARRRSFGVVLDPENCGTFRDAVSKYATAPPYVWDRMAEGEVVMRDIGTVLRQVRDAYEAEDSGFGQQLGQTGSGL